ncbi:MAG: hypothetical protein ACPHID_07800 [Thermoplasmatota archaeon]
MRHGVHFDIRHPHERAHLKPLARRLKHIRAGRSEVANVVVSADTRVPERGAWNVQLFHGLGDKGYTLNPVFLQRGRFPRVRTALTMAARRLRLPLNFTRPPRNPRQRGGRYEQVNAYGPRFADLLGDMLRDVEISNHGHVALNERNGVRADPDGPLLWMPTWDNRRFLGGPNQSSLGIFAREVALVSRHVPVQVKVHPLTLKFQQDEAALQLLAKEPGVTLLDGGLDPYNLLSGVRAVLTDTSSLGFEAYCSGLPVGIAQPPKVRYKGLHAELAQRTHVLRSGRPDLLDWAESPALPSDARWMRDLLYAPSPERNDAFAQELASHVDAI